jgi:hypothetical protein
MRHFFAFLLALFFAGAAHAQTQVQFGLQTGSNPRALGVYDQMHTLVPFASLDSTGHTLTFTGPATLSSLTIAGYLAATTSGTLTNGHCVSINAVGNLVDAGAACTTGGGGGTVSSGAAGQLSYYVSTGTTVSGATTGTGVLTALGNTAGAAGGFALYSALGSGAFTAAYSLPAATSSALGGVKPDGTTLTNTSGAISVTYGTAASTSAQGNDSRITGALQTASLGSGVAAALGNTANANGGAVTLNGSPTVGDCLKWSSTGVQDAGACGGSGTVGLGTANSLAYYSSTGTTVYGATTGTGVLTALGAPLAGSGALVGATSPTFTGNVTINGNVAFKTNGRDYFAAQYGAICDGDTGKAAANVAAIQSAINAAYAAGAGRVILPQGNCSINSGLQISWTVSLEGNGGSYQGTYLKPTGSFTAITIGGTGPGSNAGSGAVRDLSIVYPTAQTSGFCISIQYADFAKISGVWCVDAYDGLEILQSNNTKIRDMFFTTDYVTHGFGIYIHGNTYHSVGLDMDGVRFVAPAGGGYSSDLFLTSGEDFNISNSYFGNQEINGIAISANGVGENVIENIRFSNVYADGVSNSTGNCGIAIQAGATGSIRDIEFTNTSIIGESGTLGYGFCVTKFAGDGSNISGIKLVNAHVIAWPWMGIYILTGNNILISNSQISGNSVNLHGTYAGIYMEHANNVSVVGNRLGGDYTGNSAAPTQSYGVLTGAGMTNVIISNNNATGNVAGNVNVSIAPSGLISTPNL